MRIQWSEKARHDLDYIEEYISEDNPIAAIETVLKIINTVESNLSQHPAIG
ncbi:MAG: type II toxin-antitoxin system RelE/ParE family toxin, partial [Gammaproteobacteria bacterium]|nr:type II toxin-antitoxin system RelE/ParE family toxin [Gammaproteobacteria bacterium]NIR95140.1 type II toxin-antitoxin system RelE/ParE family toxin [Gammaproteobacteria bacterium]NIW50086.1 type II toxin-antitoxin system RelE/ParE family toxin [Gammaproteobacteria bacterium]NIX01919.1 type II toxin-antitoxin system RelE/ParE family toxin [Phycisphaerae bacterium]